MTKDTNKHVIRRVKYVDKDGNEIEGANVDWRFWCPGCNEIHGIRSQGERPCWTFNDDLEKPTFSPSHLTGWHDDNGKRFAEHRCHSYIKDGMIQFLDDCHHDLKGKTVPLPPLKDWRYGA